MQNLAGAVRLSLATRNWHAAVFIALAIPDICGSIETPGKSNSGARYKAWFDRYVGRKYGLTSPAGELFTFMSGGDCFAL